MAAYTWTGDADDNFNNAANWTPAGGPPGAGDTATISVSALTTISIDGGTIGGLTTNADTSLSLDNGTAFTFAGLASGTFSNGGTVLLNSTGYGTSLEVNEATLTLTGGGTISLSNNINNYISAGAAGLILDNVNNLIEGAGQIGGGSLSLTNGAAGIIDATLSSGLVVNTGSSVTTNSGTLEATSGALYLESGVNDGTTGKILAAGGNVYISGASIAGGTLESSGGGAVAVENGTATITSLTNTGTLDVINGNSLDVFGTINNKSLIALQSSGYGVGFVVQSSVATLTGGGTLGLSDNGNNAISAAAATDTLVNNETIAGGGNVNTIKLSNSATGTIDATGASNALILENSATTINNGLLEATGAAGLVIEDAVSQGAAGKILANGGNVYLDGGSITGGTLNSAGGAEIFDETSATVTTLVNAGTLAAGNGNTLYVAGTLTNTGTVALDSTGYGTELVVDSATVTLTGSGTVIMTDNNDNGIEAAAAGDTLINLNNLIEGAGQIGNGTLSLVNAAAGTIDATGASNALVLYTDGSTISNAGLIESNGSAGLAIESAITNTGAGEILAAGGNVILTNGALITGGTLATAGGVFVDVATATISALTNAATLQVQNGDTLYALGTITNTAEIALQSSGYGTGFVAGPTSGNAGTVTLTGSGTLLLSDNGNNYVAAGETGDVLLNLNNTIEGSGYFANGLSFINDSVVDDNSATNALSFNSGTTITNQGLIEDTVAGNAGIDINTTIANAGGTILASAGNVYLGSGDIQGGTLNTANGGAIVETSSGTLDGSSSAVTNLGTVQVNNGNALYLLGTIQNAGTLALDGSGYGTDLEAADATVTLTGGGTVLLSNNGNNVIAASSSGNTLINLNNTITGAGFFANGLVLINKATIDATDSSALSLNGGLVVTNTGLIESTGAGGLDINTTISNAGGTILANGGNVYLQSGDIEGGTLSAAAGSAVIETNTGTLDGSASAVTLIGTLGINSGVQLDLLGNIKNSGAIELNSTGYGTVLDILTTTVTLSGTGSIVLSNDSNNYVSGGVAGATLDNLSNIIEGAGYLGYGNLALINGGTVEATQDDTLYLDTGSTGTNTATGKWIGEGSGGLQIANGTYTNAGLIEALAASSVIFDSNATLTNLAGGTLTGGTYEAVSGTVSVTGSAVTVLDATAILSGTASAITFGGTELESSLATIASGGAFDVENSRAATLPNALLDAGILEVLGGTIADAAGITISSTGSLLGHGGVTGAIVDSGLVGASTASLNITSTVTGTGTLEASAGATLDLRAAVTLTEVMSGAGTLELDAADRIAGQTDAFATTFLSGPGTLTGTGAITGALKDNGLLSASGGMLSIAGAISGTGRLSALAGATLKLAGSSTSVTNAISGAGTLELAGAYGFATLPTAAALLVDAGGSFSGKGTLAAKTTDNGTIAASGGTLTLSQALQASTGTLQALSGAALDSEGGIFNGTFAGPGTVNIQKALSVTKAASLAGGANVTATANIALSGGATLTIGSTASLAAQAAASTTLTIGATGTSLVDNGTFTATGAGTVDIGGAFVASGLATASSGTLAFLGALTDNGTIDAAAGTVLVKGNAAGSGTLSIGATGTVLLEADAAKTLTADFLATSGGTLSLTHPADFAAAVSGFGGSDIIDLLNTDGTSRTFTNGVLHVKDGTTQVAAIAFNGSYTTTDFQLTYNQATGTTQINFV